MVAVDARRIAPRYETSALDRVEQGVTCGIGMVSPEIAGPRARGPWRRDAFGIRAMNRGKAGRVIPECTHRAGAVRPRRQLAMSSKCSDAMPARVVHQLDGV